MSTATANAIGARTARACDGCLRRRARWYCAADDAFLCQVCDSSVHDANPVARRHRRTRLGAASFFPGKSPSTTWLTRKARSPRAKPTLARAAAAAAAVPDITVKDEEEDEDVDEAAMIYSVPEMDPQTADPVVSGGFQLSDSDIADFAANMEILLGDFVGEIAEEKQINYCMQFSSFSGDVEVPVDDSERKTTTTTTSMLSLDHDAVIATWSSIKSSRSPWIGGQRPDITTGDRWPEFEAAAESSRPVMAAAAAAVVDDIGREARVMRYKEKRRTRLFAKRIRYEVRKLNAEKRPRMKGRFVKSASFPPPRAPAPAVPARARRLSSSFY